ncbi:hypothetical protein HYU93_03950 [Candidatus Daviesbacteria bacterium]|nr:hypothetical protein [Candidatus Daviesbacteria bacterium]
MPRFTRRGLLKRLAVVAPSLATGVLESQPPKKHEAWSWDTGKETFHFIGFLHDAPPHAQEFAYSPEPEKELPTSVNAIFLEDTSSYLDPDFDKIWQAFSEGKADKTIDGPTFKYCREKNIPLFLGDLSFKSSSRLETMTNLTHVVEVFTGTAMAFRDTPAPRTTRRQTLLCGLGLAIASWGASNPLVGFLNREGGKKELADLDTQLRRDIETILSDRSHPENYIVVARNAIWAKKLLFLADELRSRGIEYPKIGIIAGFGHRYLDYFFRHQSEIDRVTSMYSEVTKQAVVSKEYITGMLELNLREGSFTKSFIPVPELQRKFLEHESPSVESKG